MSEETRNDASAKSAALRPRDSATLIIVDTGQAEPTILMGKRSMGHVFMPGKYVFPGGGVDKADRTVASSDEPRASEVAKLLFEMRGTPSAARARALALAAIRETYEESGLVIGRPSPDAAQAHAAGWEGFLATGHLPTPGALTFLARAITPPGRPRRFDSRFFCVAASAIAHRVKAPSDELSSLDWFTAEQIRALDLPSITRVVIEDLMDRLKAGKLDSPELPVPFYVNHSGTFRRKLITAA